MPGFMAKYASSFKFDLCQILLSAMGVYYKLLTYYVVLFAVTFFFMVLVSLVKRSWLGFPRKFLFGAVLWVCLVSALFPGLLSYFSMPVSLAGTAVFALLGSSLIIQRATPRVTETVSPEAGEKDLAAGETAQEETPQLEQQEAEPPEAAIPQEQPPEKEPRDEEFQQEQHPETGAREAAVREEEGAALLEDTRQADAPRDDLEEAEPPAWSEDLELTESAEAADSTTGTAADADEKEDLEKLEAATAEEEQEDKLEAAEEDLPAEPGEYSLFSGTEAFPESAGFDLAGQEPAAAGEAGLEAGEEAEEEVEEEIEAKHITSGVGEDEEIEEVRQSEELDTIAESEESREPPGTAVTDEEIQVQAPQAETRDETLLLPEKFAVPAGKDQPLPDQDNSAVNDAIDSAFKAKEQDGPYEAEKYFAKALALSGDLSVKGMIHTELVFLYKEMGRYPEAAERLESFVRDNSTQLPPSLQKHFQQMASYLQMIDDLLKKAENPGIPFSQVPGIIKDRAEMVFYD